MTDSCKSKASIIIFSKKHTLWVSFKERALFYFEVARCEGEGMEYSLSGFIEVQVFDN